MRAPISVIIPTRDAGDVLGPCLGALGEGLAAGLISELIISDAGSTDTTADIANAAGATLIKGKAGRGSQLCRGAQAATGNWLLFLHADSWLEPGWSDAALTHVAEGKNAACFRLSFRAQGGMAIFVAGWANFRTRLFGLPYGDQGLLVSRAEYDKAGGYPDIALMEDVALIRKLARPVLLNAIISTGAARYLQDGWLRRGGRNLLTLLQYFGGRDPASLHERYERR